MPWELFSMMRRSNIYRYLNSGFKKRLFQFYQNMLLHSQLSAAELRNKIHKNEILLGGNKKLKIYGLLRCQSGKRMKKENRVFFTDVQEAFQNGYRPCGHCMKEEYQQWKSNSRAI